MPTKAELVAYARAHNVPVSAAWPKADVEAALRDAGYDPTTLPEGEDTLMAEQSAPATNPQQPPEVTQEEAEEDKRMSSDARFSTYREATEDELDNADDVLPPGPHVMQEKGEASEDADPGFKFANKG
jgi:hypothetical protein